MSEHVGGDLMLGSSGKQEERVLTRTTGVGFVEIYVLGFEK